MPTRDGDRTRRRFLRWSVLPLVTLAGCTGSNQTEASTERPEGWCLEALDADLPGAYDGAGSIDDVERDPDGLTSKPDAGYQCHPQGYQRCSNCRFFVQSLEGDYAGACTEVVGEIRTQDWCGLYRPTERLDETPEPNPVDWDGDDANLDGDDANLDGDHRA